jgi:hypothetical protein
MRAFILEREARLLIRMKKKAVCTSCAAHVQIWVHMCTQILFDKNGYKRSPRDSGHAQEKTVRSSMISTETKRTEIDRMSQTDTSLPQFQYSLPSRRWRRSFEFDVVRRISSIDNSKQLFSCLQLQCTLAGSTEPAHSRSFNTHSCWT